MSQPNSAVIFVLAVCAASQTAVLSGCASIWTKKDEEMAAKPAPVSGKYGVRPASAEEPAEEYKPLGWSDFSWDNLGKTSKRLTGRGPDHRLARQLYREGFDLFDQAKKAEPNRKADIFA